MLGFPGEWVAKNPPANARDTGLIPESGRSPGEENGNPVQHSCLEIPWMEEPDGLQSMGSLKSRTRLSDFTFTFHVLEKEMATHSSILAWRIPGTGEPGGLPSMGSQIGRAHV